MTRQQMLDRINEIAHEFVGCDEIWGIKSFSKARLAVMLADYETMIAHERIYRAATKGLDFTTRIGYDLSTTSPAWYIAACNEHFAATEIWRKGH